MLVTPFKKLPLAIANQLLSMGLRLGDTGTGTTRFEIRCRTNMHPNMTTGSITVPFDGYDEMVEMVGTYQRTHLFPRIAKLHKEEYNYDDYV